MDTNSSTDNANVAIFPPLLLLIFAGVGGFLERLVPLPIVDIGVSGNIVGVVLVTLSILLVVWALGTFRKTGEDKDVRKPTFKIVSTGPFAYTRNPMYLSFLLLYIGVAFIFNLEWFAVLLPLLIASLHYGVIKREESYLERKFGDEFRVYRSQVRRWL